MKKSTGILIGLGAIATIFLLPKGKSESSSGSGGVGTNYGFTETAPALGNTPAPIINYTLPPVTINESSDSNYIPQDAPISSSKKSSRSSVTIKEPTSVGNVQDYNALPEGSPTKKALASTYPVTIEKGGALTSQPTYGLGAGGTKTYTPVAPKLPSNWSWF